MTPETDPLEHGVPIAANQLKVGDRVAVCNRDGSQLGVGTIRRVVNELQCVTDSISDPRTFFVDADNRRVRLLRPVRVMGDGVAVWLRFLDAMGAETWSEGTIIGHNDVGDKPRYNVRYHVPEGPRQLGGFSTATGVHPEDIELRAVEAEPPAEDPGPHLVNEMSTALRDVSRLAVRQGANQARAIYDQVVEALSLTEQRATKAAEENVRGRVRREVEVLLTNYGAPKPDHWGAERGDAMEWLDHALSVAREQRREGMALAGILTDLGATPTDHLIRMAEDVIAKTRAEARANATAVAERAASEKINALEGDKQMLLGQVAEANAAPDKIREHCVEAMSLLAGRIPGIQGFTLPQKLREVLAYYDNRISTLELAVSSPKPLTVIAGPDRVRAVVSRALSDRVGWAVENLNRMLNENHDAVGGWFLRTLANANLAVIVYDWEGLDPTAEPVEPTMKPAAPPTLDDVKAAWGAVVSEIAKVPEVLRDILKDKP